MSFHSQYVLSHHVNFHGPTESRRGIVLFMPYPPRELCFTVALQCGKSSLKQSENSRSYKAKNTVFFCFFYFFCLSVILRLPAEESSHKKWWFQQLSFSPILFSNNKFPQENSQKAVKNKPPLQ